MENITKIFEQIKYLLENQKDETVKEIVKNLNEKDLKDILKKLNNETKDKNKKDQAINKKIIEILNGFSKQEDNKKDNFISNLKKKIQDKTGITKIKEIGSKITGFKNSLQERGQQKREKRLELLQKLIEKTNDPTKQKKYETELIKINDKVLNKKDKELDKQIKKENSFKNQLFSKFNKNKDLERQLRLQEFSEEKEKINELRNLVPKKKDLDVFEQIKNPLLKSWQDVVDKIKIQVGSWSSGNKKQNLTETKKELFVQEKAKEQIAAKAQATKQSPQSMFYDSAQKFYGESTKIEDKTLQLQNEQVGQLTELNKQFNDFNYFMKFNFMDGFKKAMPEAEKKIEKDKKKQEPDKKKKKGLFESLLSGGLLKMLTGGLGGLFKTALAPISAVGAGVKRLFTGRPATNRDIKKQTKELLAGLGGKTKKQSRKELKKEKLRNKKNKFGKGRKKGRKGKLSSLTSLFGSNEDCLPVCESGGETGGSYDRKNKNKRNKSRFSRKKGKTSFFSKLKDKASKIKKPTFKKGFGKKALMGGGLAALTTYLGIKGGITGDKNKDLLLEKGLEKGEEKVATIGTKKVIEKTGKTAVKKVTEKGLKKGLTKGLGKGAARFVPGIGWVMMGAEAAMGAADDKNIQKTFDIKNKEDIQGRHRVAGGVGGLTGDTVNIVRDLGNAAGNLVGLKDVFGNTDFSKTISNGLNSAMKFTEEIPIIGKGFKALHGVTGSALNVVGKGLNKAVGTFMTGFSKAGGEFVGGFSKVFKGDILSGIKDIGSSVFSVGETLVSSTTGAIKSMASTAYEEVKKIPLIGEYIGKAGDLIGSAVSKVSSFLGNVVGGLWDKGKELLSKGTEAVSSVIDKGKEVVSSVGSKISEGASTVWKGAKGLWDKLPGFETGGLITENAGMKIPGKSSNEDNMLIKAQTGEAVIPKDFVDRMKENKSLKSSFMSSKLIPDSFKELLGNKVDEADKGKDKDELDENERKKLKKYKKENLPGVSKKDSKEIDDPKKGWGIPKGAENQLNKVSSMAGNMGFTGYIGEFMAKMFKSLGGIAGNLMNSFGLSDVMNKFTGSSGSCGVEAAKSVDPQMVGSGLQGMKFGESKVPVKKVSTSGIKDSAKHPEIRPEPAEALSKAFSEATPEEKKSISYNSGSRTYEEQAFLYQKYGPGRAAKPGRSRHNKGAAVDIGGTLNAPSFVDTLAKYGFVRTYAPEKWHFGYRGPGWQNMEDAVTAADIAKSGNIEGFDKSIKPPKEEKKQEKPPTMSGLKQFEQKQSTGKGSCLKKATEKVSEKTKDLYSQGKDVLTNLFSQAPDFAKTMVDKGKKSLDWSQEKTSSGDLFKDVGNLVSSGFEKGKQIANTGYDTAGNAVKTIAPNFAQFAEDKYEKGKNFVQSGGVGRYFGKMQEMFGPVGKMIGEFLSQLGGMGKKLFGGLFGPDGKLSNVLPGQGKPGEFTGNIPGDTGLGSLVKKYESGNKGPDAIGYDRTGGTSYGSYQIASKVGTFDKFKEWLSKKDNKLSEALSMGPSNTGSRFGLVPEIWKKNSKDVGEYEHEFIKNTHYDLAYKKLNPQSMKLINENRAGQEMLWSGAVQHGPGGISKIVNNAGKSNTEFEPFMKDVYSQRGTKFSSSSPGVQQNVQKRFSQELPMLLEFQKGLKQDVKKAHEGEQNVTVDTMSKTLQNMGLLKQDEAMRILQTGESVNTKSQMDTLKSAMSDMSKNISTPTEILDKSENKENNGGTVINNINNSRNNQKRLNSGGSGESPSPPSTNSSALDSMAASLLFMD